jgi:glycosyltransferase involved in cell wall biosynthesis
MSVNSSGPTRVAIVTNIPAPYRLPVYEALAANPQIELKVIFCSGREPDRDWDLREARFDQVYLRERFISYRGRFIHFNPDVWGALRAFRPEVVITTGFNPTHLFGYLYARLHGLKHVAMTDGTLESEEKLTRFHRWVRRRVYAGTQSFIGASDGAFDLYRGYGINEARLFKSRLCANNAAFYTVSPVEKKYDFIFCGRFVKVKSPLFALELAQQVARRLGRRIAIAFVGSGEMESEMRSVAATMAAEVDAVFPGFARQDELPKLYGAARIFVFPTQWDPWGVVTNEACASGLPVLITPFAGSAKELVRDGENGYVLPLDLVRWVDAAVSLLTDNERYARFSRRSRELVADYSYENAARGISNAVFAAVNRERRPRVLIAQRRMTHYRVPLFEMLRCKLAQSGVDLEVVYGDPTEAEKRKNDSGNLAWGKRQPCHYLINERLCWQNLAGQTRDVDLVIVTQENKLIYNLRLLFGKRNFKLAFWGHGANLQASSSNVLLERWKAWTSSQVDWWFAYTGLTVRLVEQHGFAPERITNLENAIDTKSLGADVGTITADEMFAMRTSLGIGNGPVGLYLGSLYKEKRIDFLLEAAQRIADEVPGFHLLVIGDGSERSLVEAATARCPWLRYLGSVHGHDKALYLCLADVFLNPGMVGLSILDAFVAGDALVTTNCGIHSPEIDYLVDGNNGRVTDNTLDAYVREVKELLNDPRRLARLREGAKLSGNHYSIENMVENFHAGIMQALAKPCVS